MERKAEPHTAHESKDAQDKAKAAGRPAPSKTDVRDATKPHHEKADEPKNTDSPNRTGTQAEKKAQMGEQGGRRSPDASR